MSFSSLPHDALSTKVETIIRHYLDTFGMDLDIHFISGVLDGGRLPDHVVDTLRPVVAKLLTASPGTQVDLPQVDAELLDVYYEDVLRMTEERIHLTVTLRRTITTNPILEMEQTLAAESKLKLVPLDDRLLEIVMREVSESQFTVADIASVAASQAELLMAFARAQRSAPDHGEEWDPDEGNQQEDTGKGVALGMCPGALISIALRFLYASRKPEALLPYLKRRKTPHATKVAKDIVRLYKSTIGGPAKVPRSRRGK